MPNSKNIFLKRCQDFNSKAIVLPASKSIANRALIINSLSGENNIIHNLSQARDTQTMKRLLKSDSFELDVLDAGTTMRFLTAYLSITNQHKIITGTSRMKERPIKILVDALVELGANIQYKEKIGYPPLEIIAFKNTGINNLSIKGDVSSQYISALLMIGPLLKNGLELTLEGKIGSKPYIEMTLSVMESYGVMSKFIDNKVYIKPQQYTSVEYFIEPDWSAASYWYSLVALSNRSTIVLSSLSNKSIQGDRIISEIMDKLGVKSEFSENGVTLSKCPYEEYFEYDFSDCPDLVQTVAVVCAAKGINATLTGLESLKIKETDRVLALKSELSKLNCDLVEEGSKWIINPGIFNANSIFINTYEDHRMAMAFAPLCLMSDVTIENGSVVNKSYPKFWDDLRLVGLNPHATS